MYSLSSSGLQLPNDKSLSLTELWPDGRQEVVLLKALLQQELCGNNFCFLVIYILIRNI